MTIRRVKVDLNTADARKKFTELDTLADRLIKKLEQINVDVSVNDGQLEDALSLAQDLGNIAPSIDIAVNTGDVDGAFAEIAALESLTPTIDIGVDTGSLDSAINDALDLDGFTANIGIDVDASDIASIESDLDRLEQDRTVRFDIEADGLGTVTRAIEDAAQDQQATIEVDADTSAAEDSIASLAFAAGPFAAAGLAAGAIFGASLGDSLNLDAALGQVEARLGLTQDESQAIGAAAGNLYAGAYGESINDNLSILSDLARFELVATADVADLERAGGLVQDFAATFDVEATEAIQGVQQLVEQGLAPDFETGLDGLTSALQASQIPADELLAAVSEYSPFLQDAGVGFDDFAQILISGGASTVIEVDKVGDAIKELGLRVDGLTPEKIDEIAEAAGVSATELQTLTERLQEGDPGALQEIITVIQGIEDPAKQAALSVEFFGAAGEDAADILLNADFTTPFETVVGATEAAGIAVNDNFGVKLETLRRTALQGLTDFITANVLPTLNQFVDFLLTIDFSSVAETVIGVFDTIREAIGGVFEGVDFAAIGEEAGSIFEGLQSAAQEILPQIPPLVSQIGEIISGVVELGVQLWQQFGESIFTFAVAAIENFITILGGVFEVISGVINTVTALLEGDWAGAWQGAQQIVEGVWQVILGVISQVVNEVTAIINIFLDLFGVEANASFEGFKTIVTGAWEAILAVIGASVDFIVSLVTGAWDEISTATSVAWEAIKTVITTAWDAISTAVSAAMTAVETVVSTGWTAIQTVISTVMTAISTVITTVWTTIQTTITTVMTAIQTVVTTVWTAISTAISTVMTAISTLIRTAWTNIQTNISTAMTAIQTVIRTAWTAIQTLINTAMTAIQTVIRVAWTAIQTLIRTQITAIQTLIRVGFTAIQTVIRTVMTAIQTGLSTAWNAIRTVVTTAVTAIRTAVTTQFNLLRTGVTATVNLLTGAVGNAFNGLRDRIVGIVQGIRDTVNGIFDGIRTPDFGGIVGAAQGAANAAGNILGAIPGLADGAIVKGSSTGTIVRLAENSADEVAINAASPLNRKIDLLEKFDNGRLLQDLFSKWEAEFNAPQQAASDEFMRYATAAPAGGNTNIEVTVVQKEGNSKVQETRNALQIAREIRNEVAKVS